jgi:hypothetical protein
MRLFVKLDVPHGVPVAWGLAPQQVRAMAPRRPVLVMFPKADEQYEEVDLREFGFETFHRQPQPSFDSETHRVTELAPVLEDGQWRQRWQALPLTTDELAAAAATKAEQIKAAEHEQAIAPDSVLLQLRGMSNAQFDTWWAANVTTAAQASGVLKRLARLVLRRLD